MKSSHHVAIAACFLAAPVLADGYDMDKNPGDIPAELIKQSSVSDSSIRTME